MRIDRAARTGLATFTVVVGFMAAAPAASLAAPGYTQAPTGQFGEPGSGDGQFSEPAGVAVAQASGDVYVVDRGNDRVQEFDAQGKYLAQFDGSEAPTGQLSGPYSIAVDNSGGPKSGDVYVADVGHGVVDVFNAAGKYLSQLTGTPEAFAALSGVAVDTSGDVWVYDSAGNVDEFSDTGALLAKFNTGRETEHGFAVDSNKDVYLLFGAESVGKYRLNGSESAEQLGEWGSGGRSLAVSLASGNLFLGKEDAIEEYGPYGEPFAAPVATFATEGLTGSHAIAVNSSDGTVYATEQAAGEVDVFKTVLIPDVSTGVASAVGKSAATIAGSVKRDGLATKYHFQYGYGEGTPDTTTPTESAAGEEEEVTAALTALLPATTYHYRLVAENANGTSYGQEQTFTTLPAVATVNDQPPAVSGVTRTSALIAGTVDTEHSATTLHIEYVDADEYEPGAANPYENGASSQILGLEATRGDEPAGPLPLAGLLAGATYHYRLVANNPGGTTYGPDYAFTTAPGSPPAVTTGAASEVTQTGVLLTGAVDTRELQTSYEFEVGTDASYNGAKLFGNAGSNGTEAVSVSLQFLIPGTAYHYRLVASNEDGTSYGQDVTFTTPGVSAPIAQPPTLAFVPSPTVLFPSVAGAITKPQASVKKKPKAKHKAKSHGKRRRKAKGKRGKPKKGGARRS
jgi:hypothetical protein